jgi:hypothetical protein
MLKSGERLSFDRGDFVGFQVSDVIFFTYEKKFLCSPCLNYIKTPFLIDRS